MTRGFCISRLPCIAQIEFDDFLAAQCVVHLFRSDQKSALISDDFAFLHSAFFLFKDRLPTHPSGFDPQSEKSADAAAIDEAIAKA